jgi:hypothetical protein
VETLALAARQLVGLCRWWQWVVVKVVAMVAVMTVVVVVVMMVQHAKSGRWPHCVPHTTKRTPMFGGKGDRKGAYMDQLSSCATV